MIKRDSKGRIARKTTDEQELEMVELITTPGGPRITALAAQFRVSPETARKVLQRHMGVDAATAATHARLSEGMRGNKHGTGQKFPEAVSDRWRTDRRGEGNPNWKGGPKARHRLQYREIKAQALERDSYRCVRCKSREQLVIHHIVPEVDRPDLLHDLENLETLCRACHGRHHHG